MKDLTSLFAQAYPEHFSEPEMDEDLEDFESTEALPLTAPGDFRKVQALLRIRASFGNTHLNLTDLQGRTLAKVSAGSLRKERRIKKSAPFAALLCCEKMIQLMEAKKIRHIWVIVSGLGRSNGPLLDRLHRAPLSIHFCTFRPSIPHNGCRPPRRRRL